MNVKIIFLVELILNAVVGCNGANICNGSLCRLLHYISQLACKLYLPASRHQGSFDEKSISTHLGPCHACYHADLAFTFHHIVSVFLFAQIAFNTGRSYPEGCALLCDDFSRHLTTQASDFSFQITDSRFSGVVVYKVSQGFFRYAEILRLQPMVLYLLRYEILLSNLDLLLLGISGNLDDLHSVKERSWNSLRGVCRSYEHHLGKVKRQVKVVVRKVLVLFRVENLQKRRCRIALKVCPYFIYLVKEENRVVGSRIFDRCYYSSRDGPYVRPPVPSDFGLVSHSAQGHSHEFSSGCPGN